MKTKTYKKLKETTIYRSYIAVGLKDTTSEKQIEKGVLEFTDDVSNCVYRFYTKNGNARRYREDYYGEKNITSYQLNPVVKIPAKTGMITFREKIDSPKKLMGYVLPQVIKYNQKKSSEFRRDVLVKVANFIS